MKFKRLSKLSLLACSVIAFSGCSSSETEVKEEDPIVFETGDIKASGMAIQRLMSGTDNNNHPYQTFSYETVPVNSPYSDIDVTTTFVNGTSCSSYITTQHDTVNKTITLTCLQPFSTVIKVHLEAHYKASVYADISVRYLPKYSQSISTTLNFYKDDPQNPGQYIETNTSEAFINSFSFDVSVNTENVFSNPREGVQIDGYGIFPHVSDVHISSVNYDPWPNSERALWVTCLTQDIRANSYLKFYTNSLYPNNFSSSFLQIMQATGFDVVLPNLMARTFVDNLISIGWIAVSNYSERFRSCLLKYLNSERIDYELIFDTTNTKEALITAINEWMTNNDFYYMPFQSMDLYFSPSSDYSGQLTTRIPLLYGNNETEEFDGEAEPFNVGDEYKESYFKVAKFLMPEPLTLSELSPTSISAESSDIYF